MLAELEAFTCKVYSSKNWKILTSCIMQYFAVNLERITKTFTQPRQPKKSHAPCQLSMICVKKMPRSIAKYPWFRRLWLKIRKEIIVVYLNGLPATKVLLCLLSCDWKRRHVESKCACIVNVFKCTDMCSPKTCDNRPFEGVVDDEDDILTRNINWWKWERWSLCYRLLLAYYF